jgi:hypothetical protein
MELAASALPHNVKGLSETEAGGRIAVTLHPMVDPQAEPDILRLLAEQLMEINRFTFYSFIFVPHAAAARSSGARLSDADIGQAPSTWMKPGTFQILPLMRVGQVKSVYVDAVISTRYHALIFDQAADKPCLGIPTVPRGASEASTHYRKNRAWPTHILRATGDVRLNLPTVYVGCWAAGRAALDRSAVLILGAY